MKSKQENLIKVTILLDDDTIKSLDTIAVKQLTGSRGRAITWLVREFKKQDSVK